MGSRLAASGIYCTKCGAPYPDGGVPYLCPTCKGVFDFRDPLQLFPERVDRSQPGIWRYRHTFGLPSDTVEVTLGEGNTPLLWAEISGRQVAFKCEYINPSGSFKDRGSTLLISWLRSRGVNVAVEDSSGNAGASFAAYAARAGIRARIFVPASASGPKRQQIFGYGAEINPIEGQRSDVTFAVRKLADAGTVYASHAYLPFNLPGYATIAYEIAEQIGGLPGAVIVPAGQGGLLLGLARGFIALQKVQGSGVLPKLIAVQAGACAPLLHMFTSGNAGFDLVAENQTLAEGVRVRFPVRMEAVLAAVSACQGLLYGVPEFEILPGQTALAHLGFYVEPTSAIVWSALDHSLEKLPDPIVVILTGSGLKSG